MVISEQQNVVINEEKLKKYGSKMPKWKTYGKVETYFKFDLVGLMRG